MTLNGPTSLIDSKCEAVASGDAVEGDTEEYRPPIDELLSSAREDVARLARILSQLHCSAVLRGMDGAPRTHAELWAPIHGADGHRIASLELRTGDIDCSGSLKKLLNALMKSFARTIAERWFRLSYRRLWVIAAVAQGEVDKSMLLAIDCEQRVVGADHRARQGLVARGGSIQAPCAPRNKETIAQDLVNNIAHGVRWHDATTVLKELGCNAFHEMPPGHILSDLANANLPGVTAVRVQARALPRVLRLAQQEKVST
jgi:hypothetical protein